MESQDRMLDSVLDMAQKLGIDSYTLRARLFPVALVALPGVLGALAWTIPAIEGSWETLFAALGGAGLPVLLAELGRDSGKRKEPRLFTLWGGTPTTRRLRHRNAPNKAILAQQHSSLSELFPGLEIPTAKTEAQDPSAADEVYEACVARLRDRTRSENQFHLVRQENLSYGFRRNLWGMKPLGVAMALLGLFVVGVQMMVGIEKSGWDVSGVALLVGLIDVMLLGIWLRAITLDWVRIPAEAYAERLLAASLDLDLGIDDSSRSP